MKKNCLVCGKECIRKPTESNYSWNRRKYCSYDCVYLSKERNEQIKLKHMGRKISNTTKLKMSKLAKCRTPKYGKEAPNWKGGIAFLPYCKKFNTALKESIRNRDSRECQLCGILEKDNKRKLSIHHIHYDKENCYPDLIALCWKCNSKVNGNRNYFERTFMNKLNDRSLLFWVRLYDSNL